MKGFSGSDIKYMRYLAEHCPGAQFGQQAADPLPWDFPDTLARSLPSIEEIEAELAGEMRQTEAPSRGIGDNADRPGDEPLAGDCTIPPRKTGETP